MDDLAARQVGADATSGPRDARHAVVERDAQIRRLDELLAATATHGSSVLLSGEAGAGKSTVLEILRDRAQGTVTVRSGRCDPLSTPAPFGPLYEMRQRLPPEVVEALRQGDRPALFAAMLEELARTRNLLVVDDVHWADEASIDLLRYVGRRIRQTRCLLVCAFRSGEVGPRHPLRAFLGELGGDAERIELATLTVEGVAALAAGHDADPLAVYATTGGNPFFVTQMLSHPEAELPASVEDAVLARARRLPESAWDVLGLAGIAPEGLPLDVLDELGDTAGEDADEACRAGLLEVDAGRLRARHELIRRAFEATLPPARQRAMHARLLAVLEARSETAADTAALANHALGAGDPDATIEYALAAAVRAAHDGAHGEAAVHYADALRHEDRMDPSIRQQALESCAYERYLTGEIDAAAATISRAVAHADTPTARGRALRFQSRLAWFAGERERAAAAGHRAVEVLEEGGHDPHELAYAWSNLAQLAMLDSDEEAVELWGRKAVALARQEDDVEVLAHALNNLGTVARNAGRGGDLLEESLTISLQHGLHEHAARAYTNLAWNDVRERDLALARDRLADALAYTEARDLGTWWTYMLGTRAELHLLAGDWDRAAADARLVTTTADGPLMRHQAATVTARLALRRGDEDARRLTEGVLADAEEIGEHIRRVMACSLAVEHRWHTDERLWSAAQERAVVDAAVERGDRWGLAAIAQWAVLLDEPCPGELPEPVAAARDGRLDTAAKLWVDRGCPYEAAVAAVHTADEDARRDAAGRLAALGATGTIRALRHRLPEHGIHTVPRGPNAAARSNPAGLTPRQLEVLAVLARGASNAAVAEELVISPKTVEHHVSAILAKLDADSRGEAVARARDLGVL